MNILNQILRNFRGTATKKMRDLPRVGAVAENHAVFADRSMFDFPPETKAAIFGMGCFWGVEKLFWNQNQGIYSTQGNWKSTIWKMALQKNKFSWVRGW